MKNFFKNPRNVYISLCALLIVGAFFRIFHLSDWTHFELDQARDAKLLSAVVQNGIGDLPLLGPRAGGTFLRLAPGYYYMEYIGALLFGATPVGFVWPIAILSVCSIFIFYLLLRRNFSTPLSLILTALFSVSTYVVMYGRFAWNPNALPFFLMLGFYALLRSVDAKEQHASRFLLLATFSFTFATHLHFLAFVSVPIVVVLFLVLKRARFPWKTWVAVIGIIVLMYVPVLLNESITGGANSQEFLHAVSGKSSKSQHVILEKLVKNVTNQAFGYWVILTGHESSSFGQLSKISTFNYELTCDDTCHEHLATSTLALVIFVVGIYGGIRQYRRSTHVTHKDFILLTGLWFTVTFLLFIPLSYDFSPRFFLLTACIPFIFLGYIVKNVEVLLAHKVPLRNLRFGMYALIGIAILSNTNFTIARLREIAMADTINVNSAPDRILKEKVRVTLKQQQKVLDYMKQFQDQNGETIYMFSEPEHRRALKYLMETRGMINDVMGYSGGIYREGNYFLIIRTEAHQQNRLKKYLVSYDILEKKAIGTLTVYHLQPKPEAITAEKQIIEIKSPSQASARQTSSVPARYTWSEWWNHQAGSVDDDADESSNGGSVTDDSVANDDGITGGSIINEGE